jgi:hypothetical protein
LTQYKHVIIFGENDVSSGKRPDASNAKLLELTRSIQHHKCKVHLCTISPQHDADVILYNKNVRDICIKTDVELIDTYSSFVYGDGSIMKHYFARDGTHHNKYGSKTLVAAINRCVYIVKRKLNHANGAMRSRYYGKENSCAGSTRYRKYNLNRHERVDNFFRPRFYDQTSWSETSLNNTVRHTRTGSVFANNQ